MDWKKIGLKIGLEIHQQLDTHKLFCKCPSILRDDKPHFEVKRKLRAVAGELGEVDIAAKAEEIKNKTFVYQGYNDTTCLIELDEEPPHLINREALQIAIQIAKLLNMNVFDEIHIMRKTVIDGSNTSGFQRTALVAENGYTESTMGKVRVTTLALEEDAARKIKEENDFIYYRIDRLGIPLVELRTEPDIHSPVQAKEVAERLGLLMRMTGKVKRGLGTIRQDVNVSIKSGARVEIKGVQDLILMPKIIELEAFRQLKLIELSKKLKERKANPKCKPVNIKEILSSSESRLIKNAIQRDFEIIATKISGFSGILKTKICGEKTLAKDIVDYLKIYTGLSGFIHSDELPGYGISEKEVKKIKEKLSCSENDAFAFLIGLKNECEKGLNIIIERCQQYLKGVPKEVRKANEDGTTSFLRPMPGAARMYPETDTYPFKITNKFLKEIKIPPKPEERIKNYLHLGLSEDLTNQMIHSEVFIDFEEAISKFKLDANIIAYHLLSVKDEIRKRYQINPENLKKVHFMQTFELLEKGKIAKEAIIEILAYLARNPEKNAEDAMKALKLKKISISELRRIINKIIAENSELAEKKEFKILMGLVMRKVRGRIDGEIVAKELKEALK